MKSTLVSGRRIRRGVVPGVVALAIALTGCGAANDSSDDSASSGDSGSSESLSGTLNGGGSSAQESAQGVWRAGFQEANSGVTVNYDPVGSGTGRENFISKAYAFAGSDSALSTDEGELDAANARCGGDVIEVPAYVSPIAVIFNLPGVDALNLKPEVVAQIFDGKITTWNDPAIAADNPDADLPDTAITPVHRSDDSGTTGNFTDYLSQAGGGAWSYEPDGVWPIQGGEAAEGTSGVVAAVKAGEGTIGYADESQAGGLSIVALGVGDEFNKPSAEGAAQVLANSPRAEGRSASDMVFEIDRTDTASGSYPLILTSYLLACPTYDDANEAALVKGFLSYIVSEEGQQASAEQAGSAPLDSSLAEEAQSIIDGIK
ncbi:MAG TPA: phosphate ABC transporter substrate-binding protein PstS [Nocardioides sp.]|uniref:phosphate ABC transporter substrate-binding protein PstS n=1 Tax=uncultured Nocardioides sp. TaxID=198441 RepID=UPI00261AFD43|nr:phosphate ABC transporter substrate-binding protein PstS [uncultured Nocardioides sp.]HRI94516.1 phosphate ABC transporter substrate-binding protein PstS [Nocardioides sp.]HRK44432.1 phosphate ABC transporter substrate-binding protein PstS [Nocardioides sp.]